MSSRIRNPKTIENRAQVNRAITNGQYLQDTLQRVANRVGNMSVGQKQELKRVQNDHIAKEKRLVKMRIKIMKHIKSDKKPLVSITNRKDIRERKVLAICRTGNAINQHMQVS